MGRAEFSRTPGHHAMTYRSDVMTFRNAEIPEKVRGRPARGAVARAPELEHRQDSPARPLHPDR